MTAAPGDSLQTTLGGAVLAGSVLMVGLGKVIDLLGHVRDGAADAEESS